MNDNKRLNVLLVDDETKITELFSYSLRREPYNISTASSADQALEILANQPVNILVTDIRMPKMDGLELGQLVREMYPQVQLIIISAHGDVDSAVTALKLGAVDFLQKPVDPKILQLTLNSAAEKWNLRTQLDQAYVELAEERELLSVTLNSIGDGVIATDLNGDITNLNKISTELTGWSNEEARGQPLTKVFNIINEQTREVCENPVEKVLATGRIIGLANHTALIAKDGTEKSIADSAAPIKNRNGLIIGTVLVFRDVTLENRINTELAKTKKLESVGILAGGIAHDFNNLLAGIMGNINLAKATISPVEPAYDFLVSAEDASARAAKLTKQLLTFSKGGEPIIEAASIFDVVSQSADFTLTGSGIACRIDQDSTLWGALIDKGQIDQVIQNIILNARQAMPHGGTIYILCENFVHKANDSGGIPVTAGDYIRISIRDEGVGIQPELLEQIFDPYFSTKQEGSGLGMAVTHAIVNKHRGHIECASTEGNGTTFTIYLPAVKEIISERSSVFAKHTGSGKIMIMDDEKMIRDMTESMLVSCGYEVVHAVDGVQALELYRIAMDQNQPITAVIMDLTIPGGIGGRETIEKLTEMDKGVNAIVSSGYSNDPVMANYREYGFKAALSKPYLMSTLTAAVSKALSDG